MPRGTNSNRTSPAASMSTSTSKFALCPHRRGILLEFLKERVRTRCDGDIGSSEGPAHEKDGHCIEFGRRKLNLTYMQAWNDPNYAVWFVQHYGLRAVSDGHAEFLSYLWEKMTLLKPPTATDSQAARKTTGDGEQGQHDSGAPDAVADPAPLDLLKFVAQQMRVIGNTLDDLKAELEPPPVPRTRTSVQLASALHKVSFLKMLVATIEDHIDIADGNEAGSGDAVDA
jgi:hypothetical protein